jgi:uncharacterized repeat protein (TIGR01451 family)
MAAEPAVKENVIEMRKMTATRLALSLAAALLLALVGAASASAAVTWRVTSSHGPQTFVPRQPGQYFIQAFNVGDADTTADYTITDTLPDGVSVTSVSAGWTCIGLPGPTVTCSHSGTPPNSTVFAPAAHANRRGGGATLVLTVAVDPDASGTGENRVTVSGGGPGAVNGSDIDSTTFGTTQPGFGFVASRFLADVFDGAAPDASPVRQAGAHPFEYRVDFATNLTLKSDPDISDLYTDADEHVKALETRLPRGMIGNPDATPRCAAEELNFSGVNGRGNCPANTQVGTMDLVLQNGKQIVGFGATTDIPVYNMTPPPGTVAAFGLQFNGTPVWILASLDPSDYSVVAQLTYMNETFGIRSAKLSMWGVPADPAHDALRLDPAAAEPVAFGTSFSGAPIKPFLTLPSECGVDKATRVRAESWQDPGDFKTIQSSSWQATGCNDPRFRFRPTLSIQPESHQAGAPTGLDVTLSVPQKDDAVASAGQLYEQSGNDAAIPTPPLKDVRVTLPDGMTVSPSSANGLAACSPLQIGLGTNDDPTCPDASKVGSVSIDTPLLPDPLTGSVYFATQNENPFNTLLAIYIVARGPGVIIKLPGKVAPDPATGQLTTTFDGTPQLPFSTMRLHFNGGPYAPLMNPQTCGEKTTTATLTSWNGSLPAVNATDRFTIDGSCARGFDPTFKAGTTKTQAGSDAALVTRFTRGDGDQELSRIEVNMPEGVLGRIARLDLCSDAAANAGTCGEGSRIGTTTVGAGPGSNPFFITDGRVYMTGPYKGAPFGLSIVVHAKAGPIDLGDVVVRAAVFVDKHTTALRIVSDPLPTILQGIPLRIRVVDVTVDRAGFTFNPTDCSAKSSSATIGSTGGASATKSARFKVSGCRALSFAPRLRLVVGGRGRVTRGRTTPLTATLTMPRGGANLSGVSVSLPTTINARLPVINRACTPAEFNAGRCEKARAGTAVAVTPLLKDPLRGGVYFVKVHRGIPDMMIALRGQVDVDLDSIITIPGSKHLATNFETIPDVPVTKFTLKLVSGSHGPVGVAANLCRASSRRQTAAIRFTAQNGKVVERDQRLVIKGCKAKHKKRR